MLARFLLICASALVSAGVGVVPPDLPGDRFRLTCSGIVHGPTDIVWSTALISSGVVDLESGKVYGFGLGGVPIHFASEARIVFGRFGEQLIEGVINRETLSTQIVVHGNRKAGLPSVSMRFNCRVA